ncbi:hypothetical protein GCM10018965_072290 [Nonomuraea roseola]
MRQAAELAPQPDLSAALAARRRRRTRRRTASAALAVAAVIGVAGVGTTIARDVFTSGGGDGVAVAPVDGPSEVMASMQASAEAAESRSQEGTPIEKIWPKAIFTMPAENAEGWRYRPITGVSATEVMVNAESAFEKAGAIEIYNSESGTFRKVTDVPTTPGLKWTYPQDVAFDAQSVVWWVNATGVREIWIAPLAGGEARLVATHKGEHQGIEAIAVKGEHIYWSEQDGTVWRLLAEGGTPEKIADGLHLIDWPWASDVYEREYRKNQTKVVNLETGETRQITAATEAVGLRCGPTWCVAEGLVQRVDGTGMRKVGVSRPLSGSPALDRYVSTGTSVLDLETDSWVTFPENPNDWLGIGTSSAPSTITYWGATKGSTPDEFRIVNLAAAQ